MSGVTAAAAEAGGEGDAFLEMDFYSIMNVGSMEKAMGRATNQISRVGRQSGIIAAKLDSGCSFFEGERIIEGDRMEKRFQFMKAVGTFAQDVEEEINFAGGEAFEGHAR